MACFGCITVVSINVVKKECGGLTNIIRLIIVIPHNHRWLKYKWPDQRNVGQGGKQLNSFQWKCFLISVYFLAIEMSKIRFYVVYLCQSCSLVTTIFSSHNTTSRRKTGIEMHWKGPEIENYPSIVRSPEIGLAISLCAHCAHCIVVHMYFGLFAAWQK